MPGVAAACPAPLPRFCFLYQVESSLSLPAATPASCRARPWRFPLRRPKSTFTMVCPQLKSGPLRTAKNSANCCALLTRIGSRLPSPALQPASWNSWRSTPTPGPRAPRRCRLSAGVYRGRDARREGRPRHRRQASAALRHSFWQCAAFKCSACGAFSEPADAL